MGFWLYVSGASIPVRSANNLFLALEPSTQVDYSTLVNGSLASDIKGQLRGDMC